MEKKTETFDEKGVTIEKSYYGIQTFRVTDFVVRKGSCDYEGCVLTPWNVLSCYLESILQVINASIIHEASLLCYFMCNQLIYISTDCLGWICSRDSWKCI